MDVTFSVIVPVYGVEKYLDKCVESVLAQTCGDFELILVDDKSPDKCPAMCDAWAQKDPRIRVIHHRENQGVSAARNHGMEYATGKYILFADADDWLSPDMLEQYSAHLAETPDIIASGACCAYENKQGVSTWTETLITERFVAGSPQKIAQAFIMLNEGRLFPFVWNKAYRREFLVAFHASFENERISEDLFFNIVAFSHAKTVILVDKAFYYYRKPAHETAVSAYRPEFFDLCKRKFQMEKQLLKSCDADTGENRHVIMTSYIKHILSAIIRNCSKNAHLRRKNQCQLIKKMLDDPITMEVMKEYTPQGLKMKVIVFVLRRQLVGVCLMIGMLGNFTQTYLTTFYKKYLIR